MENTKLGELSETLTSSDSSLKNNIKSLNIYTDSDNSNFIFQDYSSSNISNF